MKTVFVFDIDNTLTPPREALTREVAELLKALGSDFALAAGSDLPLLREQFFDPLQGFGYRGTFDAFICNGASRYRCTHDAELTLTAVDEFSLCAHLGDASFHALIALLNEALVAPELALPPEMKVIGARLVDRGSMINLAPIGRPPGALSQATRDNRDRFVEFDQAAGYRTRALKWLQQRIATALPGKNVVVTLGGQTSFDIVVRGRDKSFAVRSLLAEGHHNVTYVGDALFPGGNDAAVLDFVNGTWPLGGAPVTVVQVNGFEDTAQLIEEHLRGASE
jgi:phosphomannomutase